jgi:hypothetical protein
MKPMHNLYKLPDSFFSEIEESLIKRKKQENDDIEYILRNYVKPVIRGKIKKWKIRVRGLHLLYGPSYEILGIIQRGYLIDIKGNKTKLK